MNSIKQIDIAVNEQIKASDLARFLEAESLPEPPAGFPSLLGVDGAGFEKAIVLGYQVKSSTVNKVLDEHGNIKQPGDDGYYEAQIHRLTGSTAPDGWTITSSEASCLYAIVDGNPMKLESEAKALGYVRALATSPSHLFLTEL